MIAISETETTEKALIFRAPNVNDANEVYNLIRESKPLDLNSRYNYLLLCDHFQDTCIIAEAGGHVCGFISGYFHPKKTNTFFLWQIATHSNMRKKGLGRQMLDNLFARPEMKGIAWLETTISPSNTASQGFFRSFAAAHGAECTESLYYNVDLFGDEGHEEECLFRIGPLSH